MSPVRPRRQKVEPPVKWTGELHLALSIGPRPGSPLTDEQLRTGWALFGARVIYDEPHGQMPWGFWAFDPRVPDDLRATRPELRPVLDDPEAEQAARDAARAARDDLEARRTRWLTDRRRPTTEPPR